MKQILGCFGLIALVVLIFIYAFDRAVVKEPAALRQVSADLFETPEIALETWLYAQKQRDYQLYLECLGKSGDVTVTEADQFDMKLWSRVLESEVVKSTRYGDLAIIRLKQDSQAPNGSVIYGQLEDYYFHYRDLRWVYLPPGMERTIVWVKSIIWNIGK